MIRQTLFALTLMAATGAGAQSDPRLASRLYDANQVVRVEGRLGVQTTIAFGEDELIENIAIGDSANWQVTPNKKANLLFVKPLLAKAGTNLTVVTDRRTYFFDLAASPSSQATYVLRFRYPEKPVEQTTRQPALTEEESGTLAGDVPADPAELNFAWRSKGSQKLLPHRVYDDGSATYLAWGAKQEIPAILVLNPAGEEGPVNYSVQGDVIVIDDVPAKIILRSGREDAALEYAGKPDDRSRLADARSTKE
jgi:type IV secretion system protein VirB9